MAATTLTGQNDFGRNHELRSLVDDFVAEYGTLSLERLDGEEAEFVRISEALTSLPFLANKKMVLLGRPSGNTKFAEAAAGLITELPDTTELILIEPKFDKRSSLYKLLKKITDFREFNALDGPQLSGWLVGRAKELGATVSAADARLLVERVGHNQQLLAGELDKLRLYDPHITRETIELLTDKTPQSSIFELIEAAFAGNGKRALVLYDEQRQLKVEPIQIIAMFSWQLHLLALLKTADGRNPDTVAREAKLNPYTANKSQHLAQQISLPVLRQMVERLVTIDRRSKRESIDLDEALRQYILELSR